MDMSGPSMARTATGLASVAAAACAALLALPSSDAPATAARASTSAATSSCFWVGPYTTKRGPRYNQAFPDAGAVYWTARYTPPAGATLRLTGKFAHARYQSLSSYGTATGGPVDSLNDISTKPDRGSVNPFKTGARRNSTKRAYTLTVSTAASPGAGARRPRNTLYAGVPGRSDQELIYRVYLADEGRDLTGGTGLPAPELKLADGTVLRGPDACAVLHATGRELEASSLPLSTYLALRDQPNQPPTFPAVNPPRFGAYYSTAYTLQCVYQGNCDPHPARTGGQYSNVDNSYVGAFLNRGFGSVLVLRGKLPETPATRAGGRRMRRGQLRYWSLCQNESFTTTAGAGCLYDEQVPIDRHRRYVIVTSRPADRPKNARRRCGVGFIPWPARGDGAGHPDDALLLLRNMLPSSGFHHPAQATKVPGDEEKVMGPYLPRGRYTTTRQFERRGC
jgi:hypothetical protein